MTAEAIRERIEDGDARVRSLMGRVSNPPTAAEHSYIEQAREEVQHWRDRLARVEGDARARAAIGQLSAGMTSPRRGGKSLGQQFIESEVFQWLRDHRGALPTGKWNSPISTELGGLYDTYAATITEDPSANGVTVPPQYLPGIVPLPLRALVIRDLMAPGTTTSNVVATTKESSVTNAAAAVAEGGTKPESAIAFTAVNEPVRKIATWIPVTDEALEDIPAMKAYIDSRLRLFVQLVEDDQLLQGNGTAPNLSGILDRPGLAAPIARTTETNPDVILKQISAIETQTNLPVDGVVMNPANWNSVLLLKAADGTYIAGGGPLTAPGPKTLWGRSVAVTPAITANTALVGAFKSASQVFARGGLRVDASNSHQDFFIKNLVAIRAEERLALCVYRESAFGLVTNLN